MALDPEKQETLTAVVPKVKYSMFFRLPYWGGVVIVHASGKVEDLNAEQAMADPRLAGKWIYPISLARTYVLVQNYASSGGIFSSFGRFAGKLEVERLQGDNQFPFLTQGSDKRPYLVTATKGEGSAAGLFRMYYVDAASGVGSFHEFTSHEVIYGAGGAMKRVSNIPGFQWRHEGDKESSGVAVPIEPVYIVRPNDPNLYWKFTVTNVSHSGISATLVSLASRPDEFKVFTKRADFEAWLQGKAATPEAPTVKTDGVGIAPLMKQIRELNTQLLQRIGELEQRVNALQQR